VRYFTRIVLAIEKEREGLVLRAASYLRRSLGKSWYRFFARCMR